MESGLTGVCVGGWPQKEKQNVRAVEGFERQRGVWGGLASKEVVDV